MKTFVISLVSVLTIACGGPSANELKQRELDIRERELNMKEREMQIEKPKHSTSSNTFIPENANPECPSCFLKYSTGNRPSAEVHFNNGPVYYLIASCADPYPFCIKTDDGTEVGQARIKFNGNKVRINVNNETIAGAHANYLNSMDQIYVAAP